MIPPTTNNRASAHIYLKMAVATAVFIKTPGSAGCFDTRKRFCVPFIWRANIAFGMHPRQSCGASSLDWERETLPIEGSNKGPVTRRGLLLPNLHKSSFPSRIFPAVILFFCGWYTKYPFLIRCNEYFHRSSFGLSYPFRLQD